MEREAAIAEAVTDFLNGELLSAVDPGRGNATDLTMREALDTAAAEIEGSFEDQPLVEARIRSVIGDMYYRLSEPALAEPQFRASSALYDEHDDPASDRALLVLDNIATMLMAQRKPLEARDALEEEQRRLDTLEDPPGEAMLRVKGQLSTTYLMTGDYAEAAPVLVEVLALKEKQLGPEHPSTLVTLNNLGSMLFNMNRFEEAVVYLRRAYEGRERVLGETSPRTILTLSIYAATLGRVGELGQALEYAELAAERSAAVLGTTHGASQAASMLRGRLLLRQDRNQEAFDVLSGQYEADLAELGAEHPQTLESLATLSLAYSALGRSAEALPLVEAAIPVTDRVMGPGSIDAVVIRAQAIRHLVGVGDFERATEFADALVEETTARHGLGPPATARAYRGVAWFLERMEEREPGAGYAERLEALRDAWAEATDGGDFGSDDG